MSFLVVSLGLSSVNGTGVYLPLSARSPLSLRTANWIRPEVGSRTKSSTSPIFWPVRSTTFECKTWLALIWFFKSTFESVVTVVVTSSARIGLSNSELPMQSMAGSNNLLIIFSLSLNNLVRLALETNGVKSYSRNAGTWKSGGYRLRWQQLQMIPCELFSRPGPEPRIEQSRCFANAQLFSNPGKNSDADCLRIMTT